jgi:hypothetical protein
MVRMPRLPSRAHLTGRLYALRSSSRLHPRAFFESGKQSRSGPCPTCPRSGGWTSDPTALDALLTSLHSSRPALSVHSAVGDALPRGCQARTSSLSEMTTTHQRPQGRPIRATIPDHQARAMPAAREACDCRISMQSQCAIGATAVAWPAFEVEISSQGLTYHPRAAVLKASRSLLAAGGARLAWPDIPHDR